MTTELRNYANNKSRAGESPPISRKRASELHANAHHNFQGSERGIYEAGDVCLRCSREAGEIQALLESVGEECNGPIERLPYVEFVEKAETITLAELRGRFAEGPDAEGEEADYLDRVLAVLNSARPASE